MHHINVIKDGNVNNVVKEQLIDGVQYVDNEPHEGSLNGITSGAVAKVAEQITTAEGDIDSIEEKIPSGASSSNKLVTESGMEDALSAIGTGYTPKGNATVATLEALTGQSNGDMYIVTDSGTLNNGALVVSAGNSVAWDSTNEVWYKTNQYATQQEHDALTTYAQKVAHSIAPEFDPNKVGGYAPHDKVLVDNKLVEFTTFHTGGAVNTREYVNVTAIEKTEEITFSKGGSYLDTAAVDVGSAVNYYPGSSANLSMKYAVIDVSDALLLDFSGALGHVSGRLWAFVKADGTLISKSTAAQSGSSFTGVEYVPLSAKYALVNLQAGSVSVQKRTEKDVIKGNYISTSENVGVSIGGIVTESSSYNCTIIKCTEGELFRVRGLGGYTPRTWAFVSSSFAMLSHASADVSIDGFIEAPQGSTFLIFQVKTTFSDPFVDKCGAAEIPYQTAAQQFVYRTSVVEETVDFGSRTSAETSFVCSVSEVAGYKYLLAIGEGAESARLWAFLDENNEVLSNSDADVIGQFLVQIPSNAKRVVFQSRNYGKCFLLKSESYTPSVQSELQKMNNPTLEVLAGCFDSSGYMRDCYIPINLFKENKCAIVNLEIEYLSGNPYFRFYVDGIVSSEFIMGSAGGKRMLSFRVPPAILGGNTYLRFNALSNANFKLKSIGIEYADPKASDNCGMRFDAHLGLQTFAPENTMVAYELASKVGFHGCIVNPIFSADGTAYCYHEDDSVLTLDGTNAVALTGEEFETLTDSQVTAYKVFGFGSQRSNFLEAIPRLDEFLKMCSKTGIKPVFSTHPVPTSENLASLKAMVEKYNLLGKLTLKAFSLPLLENAYAVFGKIEGYVYDVDSPANIDSIISAVTAKQFFTDGVRTAIEVNFSSVTEEMVAKVKAAGLEMGVYEINPSSANYNNIIEWGVSFITEDGKNCNAGMNW